MESKKQDFKMWGPSNIARALACPSALSTPYGRNFQAEAYAVDRNAAKAQLDSLGPGCFGNPDAEVTK